MAANGVSVSVDRFRGTKLRYQTGCHFITTVLSLVIIKRMTRLRANCSSARSLEANYIFLRSNYSRFSSCHCLSFTLSIPFLLLLRVAFYFSSVLFWISRLRYF